MGLLKTAPKATAFLLLFSLSPQGVAATEEPEEDDVEFLWPAPESGRFLLAPVAGISTANQMDGPLVGMRGLFAFDNFMGGIHGQSVFVDTGAVYSFGIDLHLRFGPIYGGIGFCGHFFPGNTSRPTPTINFQLGLHVPLPLVTGVFLDFAYRPNIVMHRSREVVYHTFLFGVLFEVG